MLHGRGLLVLLGRMLLVSFICVLVLVDLSSSSGRRSVHTGRLAAFRLLLSGGAVDCVSDASPFVEDIERGLTRGIPEFSSQLEASEFLVP